MKSTFAIVLLAVLLVACNGGGTRVIPPPPPPQPGPPMLTITAPLANTTLSGMVNISASLQNVPNALGVRFEVNGVIIGAEDTSAPYGVSWDTRSVANGAHSLQAIARLASGETLRSIMVNVTVQNTVAPTVTFPQTTITVALGATITIHASVTGDPAPTQLTCTPPSFGSVVVQGFNVTYIAATTRPASFVTNFVCSVQTSAGNAQTTITVNLQNPVPGATHTSFDGDAFEGTRTFSVVGLSLIGSGLYSGGTLTSTCGTIQSTTFVDLQTIRVNFGVNENPTTQFSPGGCTFTYTSPSGEPGGGTATWNLAFLGNFNTLSVGSQARYHIDQGADSIRIFNAQGSQTSAFGGGHGLVHQIATDGTRVVESNLSGEVFVYDANGSQLGSFFNARATASVDAKFGWLVAAQHQDDRIMFADLTQPFANQSAPQFCGIVGQPWLVKLFQWNSEPVAAVFLRQALMVMIVKIPSCQIVTGINVNAAQPGAFESNGFWQMEVLNNATIALLPHKEKALTFFSVASGQEIRRVLLLGRPYRIAGDDAHNTIIVGIADAHNNRTNLVSVSASSGVTTSLTNHFDFIASGLAKCGANICGAGRSQFAHIPLQ